MVVSVSGVLWHFPVSRVCVAVGGLVGGQRLLLLFDACAITCGRSFAVLGVWVDLISFRSVLVFSPALLSLLFLLLIIVRVLPKFWSRRRITWSSRQRNL